MSLARCQWETSDRLYAELASLKRVNATMAATLTRAQARATELHEAASKTSRATQAKMVELKNLRRKTREQKETIAHHRDTIRRVFRGWGNLSGGALASIAGVLRDREAWLFEGGDDD